MIVKVIATTDRKHLGEEYDVPNEITYQVASALGMLPDTVTWFGDTCTLQNSNYTIKLKRLRN